MNSLVGKVLQILEVVEGQSEPKIEDEECGCAKTGLVILSLRIIVSVFPIWDSSSYLTFLHWRNIYN